MSLWSKIKHAAHEAAKTVSHAATTVVNTTTEVVSDVVETAGNAVESGLNYLGDQAAGIPGIGGALQDFGHYLGRISGAVSEMAAAGVKASGGVIGSGLGGSLEIGFGVLTFDGSLIKEGTLLITSGIVSGILLFGAKSIAGIDALVPGMVQRRPLSEAEKTLLRRVFKDSVALANVRLIFGRYEAGWLGIGGGDRAYTVGNTIYMKFHHEPDVLVHEVTHVWQYQHIGSTYLADAAGAQKLVPDAYNWEREIDRGKSDWRDFNREAQGQLLQDIYLYGGLVAVAPAPASTPVAVPAGGHPPPPIGGTYTPIVSTPAVTVPPAGDGTFYDADNIKTVGVFPAFKSKFLKAGVGDDTALANDAVATVRGATSFRPSRWL